MFIADWFKSAALDGGEPVTPDYLDNMQEMEQPLNLDRLVRLGAAVAEKQADAAHFREAMVDRVRLD